VRQEKISADNVYQLLLAFDKLYNTFTEVEQRDFTRSFIERIDIYPEKPDNGCWIRNIVFNFPMPVQGREIKSLPLESESTVETVVLLNNNFAKAKDFVQIGIDAEEYYRIKDSEKKTE
jgi:site-specific DNA recombinase